MSDRKSKRYMAPFIVSASDLAFIMLFFFIVVGNGRTQVEKVEMPYKEASSVGEQESSPLRIEIYDQDLASDSSRLVLIRTNVTPTETSFVAIDNKILGNREAQAVVRDHILQFVSSAGLNPDSMRVDVCSSARSYYGLAALAMAACYKLEYPCNLVYRADESQLVSKR